MIVDELGDICYGKIRSLCAKKLLHTLNSVSEYGEIEILVSKIDRYSISEIRNPVSCIVTTVICTQFFRRIEDRISVGIELLDFQSTDIPAHLQTSVGGLSEEPA